MIRALFLCLTILCLGLPRPGRAEDCATLAEAAGAREGLPPGLITAIGIVESGRSDGKGGRAPWPWTLNQGGKGMFFDTRDKALAYLHQATASGVTNIDVGCMQLNWKRHSPGFPNAEAMIDPVQNTAYAARFLADLHRKLGTWELATAAYHSMDPDRGRGYVARVAAAQEDVAGALAAAGAAAGPILQAAALPVQLEGILALAGVPMFGADAGAPLIPLGDVPRADTAAPTDPDAAPPPPPQPLVALNAMGGGLSQLAEPQPDLAASDAQTAATPGAASAPPPPRPRVFAKKDANPVHYAAVDSSLRVEVATRGDLPADLQDRWSDVQAMRLLLADGG